MGYIFEPRSMITTDLLAQNAQIRQGRSGFGQHQFDTPLDKICTAQELPIRRIYGVGGPWLVKLLERQPK